MRDIFAEVFASEPVDPTEAARRGARPKLRSRFYERAEASEAEGRFAVLLDGRPVRNGWELIGDFDGALVSGKSLLLPRP